MARRSGKAVALTAVALGSAVVLYWAKDRLQEEYYLNRFVRAGREHRREIGKKLILLGSARAVPLFLKEYDSAPADCLDFISLTREIIRSERGSTVPYLEQAIDETGFYGRIYCLRLLEMQGDVARPSRHRVARLVEESGYGPIRLLALQALRAIAPRTAETRDALVLALGDNVEMVRVYAARHLLDTSDRAGAVAVLRIIADDETSAYQRSARAALDATEIDDPGSSR